MGRDGNGAGLGWVRQKSAHSHTRGTRLNAPAATPAGFRVTRGFEQSGGEFNHKGMMY
jgi:hypothetical protein